MLLCIGIFFGCGNIQVQNPSSATGVWSFHNPHAAGASGRRSRQEGASSATPDREHGPRWEDELGYRQAQAWPQPKVRTRPASEHTVEEREDQQSLFIHLVHYVKLFY
jgi:hypothetical protein